MGSSVEAVLTWLVNCVADSCLLEVYTTYLGVSPNPTRVTFEFNIKVKSCRLHLSWTQSQGEFHTLANLFPAALPSPLLARGEENRQTLWSSNRVFVEAFPLGTYTTSEILCNFLFCVFNQAIPTFFLKPLLFYVDFSAFQPVRKQTYASLINNSCDENGICFLFPLVICLQIKLITLEMRFANYLTWSNPISHSSIKILGGKISETNVLHIHYDQSTRIVSYSFSSKNIHFTCLGFIVIMRHVSHKTFNFF